MNRQEAPGWYGKVAALGDFASRRLDHEWVQACDRWLSDCVSSSQSQLGDRAGTFRTGLGGGAQLREQLVESLHASRLAALARSLSRVTAASTSSAPGKRPISLL